MNETGSLPDESWSDDEVFARLRPGDPGRRRAFEILFDRYHGKVLAWCRRVLKDRDAAADRTQEVFLGLLERPPPYRERARFGSWLYVLTRNRCLNERKRESRRIEGEVDEILADVYSEEEDPSADVASRERRHAVREACRRELNPREQEVIYLRHHWGMKVAEITETLGLTNASGARTHLRSAEKKLRDALTRFREGGET